jgi:tetratricopeptide (TPR) repeat protein
VQRSLAATTHPSPAAASAFHWVCTQGVISDIVCNRESGRFVLAERFLAVGLEREPNDPVMNAVNASYCYWTGNERGFRDALDRTERLNRQTPSSEANSLLPNLRQFAARGMGWGKVLGPLNKAIGAANAGNFHQALRHLKEAENIDPNVLSVQSNKCYFAYRTGDRSTAIACLLKAEGLVTADTPQDAREELETLRRFLFGG